MFFAYNDPATTEIYPPTLHAALRNFHGRVLEGREAALVRRELFGVGATGAGEHAEHHQDDAEAGGHGDEQQDGPILGKHDAAYLRASLGASVTVDGDERSG